LLLYRHEESLSLFIFFDVLGKTPMAADTTLIKRIKKGDQKALEILYEKYYYRLCDFAFQYVHSFDLTEEVVSDVFLKIWTKSSNLKAEGNFKAYLYTAVRNQALNYIQREPSLEHLEDLSQQLASAEYQADEKLLFQEFQNQIEALINTLPPRRKMVFKLSRLEGFTYREIAEIMSISVHTVQNHMVQAVKQLNAYSMIDER
jgi:RNA polymerase sigma-70 factor (ECF subfamily)